MVKHLYHAYEELIGINTFVLGDKEFDPYVWRLNFKWK